MPSSNNHRIAKNTIMLYIRMIFIMGLTFYITRIVLEELGEDDYGVYMVVGGVVSMLSFLNSCMATATQRYFNFELGNPYGSLNKMKDLFSTSFTIHCCIALVVMILAEGIGVWFINNKLVIPAESIFGANVVFQSALLIFCLSIIQVPFVSLIIAHEEMQLYATVSVIDVILKLGAALGLYLTLDNKLAFYGIYLLIVQLITLTLYGIICFFKFKETNIKVKYIRPLFKEMSRFAAWNVFGSLAWLIRSQGMGIILNIFFGPALNAAKGIADQVSSGVSSLCSNFQTALNPQITKNYANGNISEMELLAYRGIKFSCILLWLVGLPILINLNAILHLWLDEVPSYTNLFIILIICDGVVSTLFGTPLMTSLAATGKIRTYQIVVSSILILILPFAYLGLKVGLPPESVFYLNILFNILAGLTRLWFCKHQIGFSQRFYIKYTLLPVVETILLSTVLGLLLSHILVVDGFNQYLSIIILSIVSIGLVAIFSWVVAFNKHERQSILLTIKMKFFNHGKNL